MSTPTEKYVTHWDISTAPHWITRLENGKYQSYHYIQEAADQNTAHLNELVKLRSENAELRAESKLLNAAQKISEDTDGVIIRDILSLRTKVAELERENAALRIEIKDAGMKGLSVALEAYTRDLQDVKAENAALQQDKEKLLKIIADLESLSHHAMREANRGGAGYDINEELKEARAIINK